MSDQHFLLTLTKLEKLVLSFMVAFSVPWLIAILIGLIFFSKTVTLVVGIILCLYTLIFGFQKNGELEQSIGGLFGQFTNWWVIPEGISWWIPRPFGSSLRPISIAPHIMDYTVKEGNSFKEVKTRDGGTVEVGVVTTWEVCDATKAARLDPEDLEKEAWSLTDRGIRFFALYYDSDEHINATVSTALSNQKQNFSLFLMGEEGITGFVQEYSGSNTTDPSSIVETEIPNDLLEKAAKYGIKFTNVDVNDVVEPAEVREARNKAAAEKGQAETERLDMQSVRRRILELMWGTFDPKEIAMLKKWGTTDEDEIERIRSNGETPVGMEPLMPEHEARRTVRAARKDLEDINVSGSGGDFTKGQIAGSRNKRRQRS